MYPSFTQNPQVRKSLRILGWATAFLILFFAFDFLSEGILTLLRHYVPLK